MQDLVVCVGEKCHQSGAELVLKSYMDIIAREKLENTISLKCSFAIGGCCSTDEVSVRFGETIFKIDPRDADLSFHRNILSNLTPTAEA